MSFMHLTLIYTHGLEIVEKNRIEYRLFILQHLLSLGMDWIMAETNNNIWRLHEDKIISK